MTYGNLTNRILEEAKTADPEVGMGATFTLWSDRHAGTIVRVISPNRIAWKRDRATRTDSYGMSDAQSYVYEQDPDAAEEIFSLRKTGRWVRSGDSFGGLVIGVRDEHYDFSF